MVIAVEGMDGVGKTTVAKTFANLYGFEYIEKPIMFILENLEKVCAENVLENMYKCKDKFIKTWFFALGNLYAIKKNKGKDIILDRHYVSNYILNSDENSKKIYNLLIDEIGKPDITIVLHANIETRISRIKQRNANDKDLLDKDIYSENLKKITSFMKEYNFNYEIIDTSNLNIQEVVEKIKNAVDNLEMEGEK